ncbi:MAG: DJ-1/PfpI family protein [Pseudonocardia sp.]
MGRNGKIGVLIEDHFDQTEFRRFNEYFPSRGYDVEYLTHLWGQPQLSFGGNPDNGIVEEQVTVTTEVGDVDPADYRGIVLIGAYAMDRLRYETEVGKDRRNAAPAVEFLRRAMGIPGLRIGTICHSLWLLCADADLIRGRRVTCAHNIVCDIENAGGVVVYDGTATATIVVDGNLVTAKHPDVTDEFMARFVREIEHTGSGSGGPHQADHRGNPARQEQAMPTEEQIRSAVQSYVDSFNQQDRTMFLSTLAEGVTQVDPVGSLPRVGKQALAAFWDGLYGQTDKVDFEIRDLIVSGAEAALVFRITQHNPVGSIDIDGVDVFTVSSDGRITMIKGYSDAGHVRRDAG